MMDEKNIQAIMNLMSHLRRRRKEVPRWKRSMQRKRAIFDLADEKIAGGGEVST